MDLITNEGRTRLVMASRGAPRDYLTLTSQAMRLASDRVDKPNRPRNRITAEDVNSVSRDLRAKKDEELQRDSGEVAERLRAQLGEILNFCLDHNKTNVFLVEAKDLRDESWGRHVGVLADLRLIHQIGTTSIQASGAGNPYRGRTFAAFTLDLSTYTATRSERIRPVEFWTAHGKQDLRRVGLIYIPSGPGSRVCGSAPVDWSQESLPGMEGP